MTRRFWSISSAAQTCKGPIRHTGNRSTWCSYLGLNSNIELGSIKAGPAFRVKP